MKQDCAHTITQNVSKKKTIQSYPCSANLSLRTNIAAWETMLVTTGAHAARSASKCARTRKRGVSGPWRRVLRVTARPDNGHNACKRIHRVEAKIRLLFIHPCTSKYKNKSTHMLCIGVHICVYNAPNYTRMHTIAHAHACKRQNKQTYVCTQAQ